MNICIFLHVWVYWHSLNGIHYKFSYYTIEKNITAVSLGFFIILILYSDYPHFYFVIIIHICTPFPHFSLDMRMRKLWLKTIRQKVNVSYKEL